MSERKLRRICIYCGSSRGERPEYAAAGARLGTALAEAGIGIVYGGASIGIMGAVADAALAAGGEVIGVIPDVFIDVEVAHEGLTQQHVVASMHERKAMMADLSDAFVALPGGIGTLEELFETWTWGQIGYHSKPLALMNIGDYWDGLSRFLDFVVAEGFMKQGYRDMVIVEREPAPLLAALRAWQPALNPKIIAPPGNNGR